MTTVNLLPEEISVLVSAQTEFQHRVFYHVTQQSTPLSDEEAEALWERMLAVHHASRKRVAGKVVDNVESVMMTLREEQWEHYETALATIVTEYDFYPDGPLREAMYSDMRVLIGEPAVVKRVFAKIKARNKGS